MKNREFSLLLGIPTAFFLTIILFFLTYYIAFNSLVTIYPYFVGRFLPPVLGISTGVFSNWGRLFFSYFIINALVLLVLYLKDRQQKFGIYIFVVYVVAFFIQLLFVGLSGNTWEHLHQQTVSMANGIYYMVDEVLMKTPGYKDLNSFQQVLYVVKWGLFSNNSGFSLPGTTHPAGETAIAVLLYNFSKLFPASTISWALIITLLNNIIIVVIANIVRLISSEKNARLASLLLIVTPIVTIHFCALYEGLGGLFLAVALYFVLKGLKSEEQSSGFRFYYMVASLFFILEAQISYAHGVPILACCLSLVFVIYKFYNQRYKRVLGQLIILPILYFSCESLITSGHSVWFIRAFKISRIVQSGLIENGRPLFFSQLANLTMMSFMGGFLLLPVVYCSFRDSVGCILQKTFDKGTPGLRFLALSLSIITIFLIFQKTVRLEVERTWFWFFIASWPLVFLFFDMIRKFYNKLGLEDRLRNRYFFFFLNCQLLVSLIYVVCFQDYY